MLQQLFNSLNVTSKPRITISNHLHLNRDICLKFFFIPLSCQFISQRIDSFWAFFEQKNSDRTGCNLPKHFPKFEWHFISLLLGERVQARAYQNFNKIWKFGIVTHLLSSCYYLTKLDSVHIFKRCISQLHSIFALFHNYHIPNHCKLPRVIFSFPRVPEGKPAQYASQATSKPVF